MSDDDGSVSDVELGDELNDFDPLLDPDGAGEAGKSPPADPEDGEEGDGEESDEGAGEEAGGAGGAMEADASEAARRQTARLRRPRIDHQAAQAVGTRRILVVPAEDRVTSNVMTKAEATRAIALRAQQIASYPNAYIDPEGLTRAKGIARKELYAHRSPLVLRRCVGRTRLGERVIEKWPVREMSYPPLN
jgi:DNA-directed RNA polymerase subunit K/omega